MVGGWGRDCGWSSAWGLGLGAGAGAGLGLGLGLAVKTKSGAAVGLGGPSRRWRRNPTRASAQRNEPDLSYRDCACPPSCLITRQGPPTLLWGIVRSLSTKKRPPYSPGISPPSPRHILPPSRRLHTTSSPSPRHLLPTSSPPPRHLTCASHGFHDGGFPYSPERSNVQPISSTANRHTRIAPVRGSGLGLGLGLGPRSGLGPGSGPGPESRGAVARHHGC